MAVSPGYLSYALEQLTGLGQVSARRMFGGVGLYSGAFFFGLIDDDVLFLRVDDSNRADFESRRMPPFQPFKDRPEFSMSYYQTPAEVLEDAEALVAWARKSVAVAAKPKERASKSKRKGVRKT